MTIYSNGECMDTPCMSESNTMPFGNKIQEKLESVADLEIVEGGFTVCNNLSHAHFEALRSLVSRPHPTSQLCMFEIIS